MLSVSVLYIGGIQRKISSLALGTRYYDQCSIVILCIGIFYCLRIFGYGDFPDGDRAPRIFIRIAVCLFIKRIQYRIYYQPDACEHLCQRVADPRHDGRSAGDALDHFGTASAKHADILFTIGFKRQRIVLILQENGPLADGFLYLCDLCLVQRVLRCVVGRIIIIRRFVSIRHDIRSFDLQSIVQKRLIRIAGICSRKQNSEQQREYQQ